MARRSFRKPVARADKPQPSIDDFLDAINVITKDIQKVTDSVNDLVEVVRNNFCDITTPEAEELLQLSAPIADKMQMLHKKLLRSPLYVGMETVVSLYFDAMTEFEELCSDLKTWHVDAPKNNHLQQTLELVKALA
ncbi:MAG: hypothetical protein IJ533_06975 [Prevotella sp.]|nr:hypothetical protein [Prevotella sp.]